VSSSADPYLSVIVPAYNEARTIARTLGSIRRYLDAQNYPGGYEVIVSADGDDGTREAAAAFGKQAVAEDPRLAGRFDVIGSTQRGGKGRGIRNGVLRARGQIIGFCDADYKTPIEELDKLLPWLDRGFDVAIGSRKVGDSKVEVPQALYRRVGSRAFGVVMRSLVGLHGIRDTQCGFKFFWREAALAIFGRQQIDGYMFDVEILRLAKLLGYRIKEVGVRWQDDGDSRLNLVAGNLKNARDILKIRFLKYPAAADRASGDVPAASPPKAGVA
jgi:dolichyl-phosphate beta-glucosyltransferase